MLLVPVVFLLGLGEVWTAQGHCPSQTFTSSKECCKQCPPGEGMEGPCNQTQTVCKPCRDSETYSENFSHTEKCQNCTACPALMRMLTPCTDTNNAVCVCDYGYFKSTITGRCEACTVCPVGRGVLVRCTYDFDTMCEDCLDETFSDQDTSLDPCLPCTVCEQPELELKSCTSFSDTVCQVFPGTEKSKLGPTESVTTADPGLRKLPGMSDNLIPIYTSILAAVLLGLVAFVIFKRWNSCKQNKQESNTRACSVDPSQTPSPEGEKLHSDSGISVDIQSLQEGLGAQHTVVKIDGSSSPSLPLHTREEVEKLLNLTCGGDDADADEETDWCSLAALLGYKEEHIASFKHEDRPIQALLSHWASQDSSTIDTLCTALKKINREDIVQSITVKPTATSTV